MRINAKALQGATFAAALLSVTAARADNSPLGLWIDHTGRGAVEIKECNGNKLCGRIVWLKDAKNNEACGEQVLGDVKPVGGNKWDNGWIYDPDSESKYDVELTPLGDKLRVVGYSGSKWLSETMTWTRAPSDLQRCSKDAAAAAPPPADAKTAVATPPSADKQSDKTAAVDNKQAATPPASTSNSDVMDADKSTKEARSESELKPSNDNAAKSDDATDGDKKNDGAGATAQNDDDGDDNGPPKKKGEALKKITQALNLRKLKNGKCKMDVPFVDMQVTFDCDDQ